MQSEAEKVPREERRNVTEVPSNELEEVLRCHVFFPHSCLYLYILNAESARNPRGSSTTHIFTTCHDMAWVADAVMGWLPLCNELAIC